MIYIQILLVMPFWCLILDVIGFADTIASWYTRLMERILGVQLTTRYPRPFTCSTCMSWWSMVVLILCQMPQTVTLALLAFLEAAAVSALAPNTSNIINRLLK